MIRRQKLPISKDIQKPLIFKRFPWLSTYLLVLAFLLVWAVIAYPLTPIEDQYLTLPEGESPTLILRLTEPWRHWDTPHYLKIAESWYSPGEEQLSFAPIYPLLVGLISRLFGGSTILASLIISWIALIASCILLVKTFQEYTDQSTTQRAVKYILLFPTAFFLFAGYSESLFLVFLLLSWQGAKKGIWWQASLFGIFASLTRFIGIYLLAAYGWMWLKAERKQKFQIAAWLFPIPLTMVFWFWFTKHFYEISPSEAVFKFWGLRTAWPWEGIFNSLKFVLDRSSSIDSKVYLYPELFAALLFILATGWVAKHGWWPEALYMGTSMIMYLVKILYNGLLTSTGRYSLVLFPGFLMLAEWGKYRWFDRLWSVFSFIWMLFLSTFFFVG